MMDAIAKTRSGKIWQLVWLASAAALWIAGQFYGAVLVVLMGAGLTMAEPVLERGKVVCRGTPVLLMFAIMFASASGMVVAVDQVEAMLAPEPVPMECEGPMTSDSRKIVSLFLN